MTGGPGFSFEFYPPRTAHQRRTLEFTSKELANLEPEFLSVTFGAGGSALNSTRETVGSLMQTVGIPVAPHVSCMAPSQEVLRQLLDDYRDRGVTRLVALRGDRPKDSFSGGPFRFANELVTWIRQEYGQEFHIEVACYPEVHPESPTAQSELKYFRQKVEAGADGAITQYFFNADSYFRFLEDVSGLGIDIPITPGIMPITNYRQLEGFSNQCGAEIPRWIRRRLESYGSDEESIRAFGLEVITALCERLLDGGAPGLHIYTLNRAPAALEIWRNLASRLAH